MFSKTCEYALRSVLFIAQQTSMGVKTSVKTISEAINSPEAFTGKILQKLVKNNIIQSIKGPYGGFVIEEYNAKNIYLSNIVKVIDSDDIYTGCGLGLEQCNAESPCPLHYKFVEIRSNLRLMLEQNTVYDLVYSEKGIAVDLFLKR